MNYKIMLDFGNPKLPAQPLVQFEREPFERPSLGGLISYRRTVYKVIACSPSNNPDNQSVTYTVRVDNPQAPYRRGQIIKKRGYNAGDENLNILES